MYILNIMIIVDIKTRQLDSLNFILIQHNCKYSIKFNRLIAYFKKG